ncbi:MAG: Zn-dependent hydrolase [Bacteroidota bacterium]
MIRKTGICGFIALYFFVFTGCGENREAELTTQDSTVVVKTEIEMKLEQYAPFKLTTDLSVLTEKEKQMLPFLFEAAKIMDEIYKMEAFPGDYEVLKNSLDNEAAKKFFDINYGPWERLNGNIPFVDGIGEKPAGSGFYPADMTVDNFNSFADETKAGLYTVICRNEDDPSLLKSIPYNVLFSEKIKKASDLIIQAAEYAEDEGLREYLLLRAKALLNDDYQASDIAWLAMKDNTIDFIIGPIETYEDALFGYKAAHESFILIKDKEWSKKLERFTNLLPKLQQLLPCEEKYKAETPGTSGNQLNAYDALYYAGDCNAGSKTIAINLPNDEFVREKYGSRKLQLKNSMRAKFEKILVPIAEQVIDESQRKYLSFDAFFTNTMFHEVGHGLGLSYTIGDKKITVREALKDMYTSIEEGKADILGLYIVDQLFEMGELGDVDLMDYYVTFFAGIFRSSRFGVASAHGKANMMRFYFFESQGAFERNQETGLYTVNFEKMRTAVRLLAERILIIQGDGDYEAAKAWVESDGIVKELFQKDLNKINNAGIPVDIVFEQGPEVLGL